MKSSPLLRRLYSQRRRTVGFTLVETAMALGIFGFTIIPIIGMLGLGVSTSQESIKTSAVTNIYGVVESVVSSNASTNGTLFFTGYGEAVDPDNGEMVYQANFREVSRMDATQGLMAKKIFQVDVVRAALPNAILGTRFVLQSKDPVQIKALFQ